MLINTRDYGTVEINDNSIIRFEDGIIGFEKYHDYILIDDAAEQSPFRCLQSVEDSELAFILLDPFGVKPDYQIEVDDAQAGLICADDAHDLTIFAIVVVPEDIKRMSVNLKAPLIINADLRKGMQYITDRVDYSIRHYVFDELDRVNEAGLCESQKAV